MRRISTFAAIARAMESVAAAPSASTNAINYRLHQAALYSSSCNSSKWFSHDRVPDHFCHSTRCAAANGVVGTMFYSAAAAPSVAQEVQAKEPPQSNKFSPKEIVLFQYEACPFCNKVKAFLDYYDFPYKIVEVNPISKKEIKWSNYKKVPILMVDGKQMVDSTEIIDSLFQKMHSELSANSVPDNNEDKMWRGWVDNHLVHVLSPNIYRSVYEALESFDYITSHGNFSFIERITGKYFGAAAMYFVSKKLKKKHNITDERAALYEAAETWVDALKGRQYLGGTKPILADLSVFGVLRPIRYLQSGKDMVEHTRIGDWYTRMENTVGQSARVMA